MRENYNKRQVVLIFLSWHWSATAVSTESSVQPSQDRTINMEHQCNYNYSTQKKAKILEETRPLVHHKSHSDCPGTKLGLRDQKLACKRPNSDTAKRKAYLNIQSEAELKKPNIFNDAMSNAKVIYDQMT
jgi:hypothetical protein